MPAATRSVLLALLEFALIGPAPARAAEPKAKIVSVDRALQLGESVKVKVENLPKTRPVAEWRLHLNEIPLKLSPMSSADGELIFLLEWTSETKEAWTKLLRQRESQSRVRLRLGAEDKPDEAVEELPGGAVLTIRPLNKLRWVGVGLVALLVVVVLLARWTPLIRSRVFQRDTGNARRPFSLGLTQMAFWFVLVVAAYFYLGVVTTNYLDTISEQVLILLGISAVTAFGAAEIDADKAGRRLTLTEEKTGLEAQHAAGTDEARKNRERVAEIDAALKALPKEEVKCKRFFYDLISDADGISLHRLQLVVWTVVLGIVFVVQVYRDLAMPEFGTTLLALMGISSGSYVGFKLPEKRA